MTIHDVGAPADGASPIVLTERLAPSPGGASPPLILELTADERSRLRGLRHSRCGIPLLLQLPRGEPLQPDEWLAAADGRPQVRLAAAAEPLLLVRGATPLELLRAAYHLGNRHVAMEIQVEELRLLDDPVLADLLERRGLRLERRQAPFLPESGAYAAGTAPSHGHGHGHNHGHNHGHGNSHSHSHCQGQGGGR